jgi:hypothetical protein
MMKNSILKLESFQINKNLKNALSVRKSNFSKFIGGLMFVSFAFLFTNNANARDIVRWHKEGKGLFGYGAADKIYLGIDENRDKHWQVNCTGPGLIGCKFKDSAISSNNGNLDNLDDFALEMAARFFDDMNDEIDNDAVNNTSGTWSKTIETQFRNRTVRIYITSDWEVDRNGAIKITTIIDSVYI